MATALGYRADIDGLRCLAVTAVVGCHAGWPGFSGGFAGVDVFFTISGFLITALLMRELHQDGRIELAGFYARRIRRILPPLALVILTTLALGFFILLPGAEQKELAASSLAATGFASNLHFMGSNTGYFSAPTQFMVLLHTWSLGIEEQFYLGWPLLVMGTVWVSKRWALSPGTVLVAVLVTGCVASFALCLVVLERSEAAAFYFTPFRAWELGAGALLALAPSTGLAPSRGIALAIASLAAIGGVTVLAAPGFDFPFAALLAVGGAAGLITAGGMAPSGPVTRLLSSKPFVWVGKRSYSWYLWHWPLLSLGRISALGERSGVRDTILVVVALGLAALTWLLIERPSRTRWSMAFSPPRRAFLTGALLSAACATLAGALWAWSSSHASSTPMASAVEGVARDRIRFPQACDGTDDQLVSPLPARCVLGAASSVQSVLVWGDSHARHLVPGLAAVSTKANVALIPQFKSGCRPGLSDGRYQRGPGRRSEDRCRAFNKAVLEQLDKMQQGRGLQGVIIASRWSRDDGWRRDLGSVLSVLQARGLRVLIVADPPSYPFDVPSCLARRGLVACETGRGAMAQAQNADVAALRRIAAPFPSVRVWDPSAALCHVGRCEVMKGDKILYSDWHHLSREGSLVVGQDAAEPFQWVAKLRQGSQTSPASSPPRGKADGLR